MWGLGLGGPQCPLDSAQGQSPSSASVPFGSGAARVVPGLVVAEAPVSRLAGPTDSQPRRDRGCRTGRSHVVNGDMWPA